MIHSAERRFDVTTDAAADELGVHPETLRRWARGHRVEARKTMSGRWMFDRVDIDQLAADGLIVERAAS